MTDTLTRMGRQRPPSTAMGTNWSVSTCHLDLELQYALEDYLLSKRSSNFWFWCFRALNWNLYRALSSVPLSISPGQAWEFCHHYMILSLNTNWSICDLWLEEEDPGWCYWTVESLTKQALGTNAHWCFPATDCICEKNWYPGYHSLFLLPGFWVLR